MTGALLILVSAQIAVRGTVAGAESHQPLSFSTVALHPGFEQRFTDAGGGFVFPGVRPGNYLLSVRQIGYAPLDTQLVLSGDTTVIQVALHHLAIELPPVTIAASQCANPGSPDPSDAALRAVFGQLQENARRLRLLSDSYPFHYTLELTDRLVNQRGDTGPPVTTHLRFSSTDNRNHAYMVGRVVERAWGPWGSPDSGLVIHSAELEDLANPDFVASHCFHLSGRDTIAGEKLIRIDFEPSKDVRSADMAGSAYLDSLTYQVRYTATALTRPDRSALRNVRAVRFWTRFHNIGPGVPLQDSLWVMTSYYFDQGARIETQRTVDVQFKRPPPSP
ncbi:MAG TPA: carboxypeptidase-like regulatory domain-containing protein [Steroidobacteraceae bacterium]|nr:carboxypeptidase-like regulatory domain-containing protein [Steroidobacteraceae bacterium]